MIKNIFAVQNEIVAKLEADNARELLAHGIHKTIAHLIETRWFGKKLTKRLITDFKACYFDNAAKAESAVVCLEYVAGMCYFCVWGVEGARTSDQRVRCFLGYADAVFRGNGDENRSRSFNLLTCPGFEENDRCHGTAAAERIAARTRLLLNMDNKLTRLAKAIVAKHEAEAQVTALLESEEDFQLAGSLPKGLL